MVVVYLPEGMGRELIASTPLVLNPGAIPAMDQTIFGTSSVGKVMAFFDPAAMLAAIPGHGDLTVKVTGQLIDGRTFVGKAAIRILVSHTLIGTDRRLPGRTRHRERGGSPR
jgi:hypothetical protein